MEKILIEVESKNDSKLLQQLVRKMGYKARAIKKKSSEDFILRYLIDEGLSSGLASEDDYEAIVSKWK